MVGGDRRTHGRNFNVYLYAFYKEQVQKREGTKKKRGKGKEKVAIYNDLNPPGRFDDQKEA